MQGAFNFVLTGTSPAAPGTAVGPVSDPVLQSLADYHSFSAVAELVGATGGTLDVYIQTSPDKGTTWVDFIHFPQLAAGAAAIKYRASTSRGTGGAAPVVVGEGTTPALAANTIVAGEWHDRLRILYVAGATTSAGAAVTVRFFLSSS